MASMQASRCPRCGEEFTCGARGPSPCACAAVALGVELQLRLRNEYTVCLCLACLRDLAATAQTGLDATDPRA